MKDNIFKYLFLKQENQYKDDFGNLWHKYRINPYNPLSYFVIIFGLILALILFGALGMWREVDIRNPFKWNRYQISNNFYF